MQVGTIRRKAHIHPYIFFTIEQALKDLVYGPDATKPILYTCMHACKKNTITDNCLKSLNGTISLVKYAESKLLNLSS